MSKKEKEQKKSKSKTTVVRNTVMYIKNGGKKLFYGKGGFNFKSANDEEVRKFRSASAAIRLLDYVEGGNRKKETFDGKPVQTMES